MLYKYSVSIIYSGYVRTNVDSGNLRFKEEFIIETNDKDTLKELISKKETGLIKENFEDSNFNFNFDTDEIIRNDMSKEITTELIEIDDDVKYYHLKLILNEKFPLEVVDFDKFFIRIKNKINEKNYRNSNMFFNDYWDYLDEIYFLSNKIRLSIKELNLNGIRPQTYFDKFEINKNHQNHNKMMDRYVSYPILLTYYDYEFNLNELVTFLNNFIKGSIYIVNLNKRLIDTTILSNNQIRKIEKTKNLNREKKIEDILKKKKRDFLDDIYNTMKSNGIDFDLKDLTLVLKLNK